MIFKIKNSARNPLAFLSLSLVFLIILWLTPIPAFSETLIEANVQDNFYISPDGITIEKQIEHCGRLGVDIREKLLKASNKNGAAAEVSNNQLPSRKELDAFSNKLLSQWRKELPFSILINGKYVKLYPVSFKIEDSQDIEGPLVVRLTLKTKNYKFKSGNYALYYTNQSLSQVTDELLSQVRDNKAYSKITLLRLLNIKMNFSPTIKILSYNLGQTSSQDPQTIYSIYLNDPKDKVLVKFKVPQQTKSSDKNTVKIKK